MAPLILATVAVIGCSKEKAPPPEETKPAAPATPTPPSDPQAPDSFTVVFETSVGNFKVKVQRALSPHGVDRFYKLVNEHFYDDARFFRVIPGFVAQFGMAADPAVNAKFDTNILDDTVKASNVRGTIVFASQMVPNTRSTQLFINLADNAQLDKGGFSPFGKIVEGLSVIDKIHKEEVQDQGRIAKEGNAFLKAEHPKLDYIKKVTIQQ